jgi:general secretion pathway protein L
MRSWQILLVHGPDRLEISVKDGPVVKDLGAVGHDASLIKIEAFKDKMRGGQAKAKRTLLRLSPDHVLVRTIQIPRAALDVIDPVLRNQIERLVPWPEQETRYAYEVKGPNPLIPDQLDVRVAATRQKILDQALASAGKLGLSPYAVDFHAQNDAEPGMVLLPLEADPAERTAHLLHAALAACFAASLMLGGAGLYLLWERHAETVALNAQVAAAAAQVDEATRLNLENARLREQRDQLVKRKREDPAVVVLIEALSRILPDNAFLTELDIQGRDTRIVGKSDNPTALITMLENAPQFDGVSFSAPTTRERDEEVETFSIVAKAVGGTQLDRKP